MGAHCRKAVVWAMALIVTACGGGGGGSAGTGTGTGGGSTDTTANYPSLQRGGTFDLPALAVVPSHASVAGHQVGRVVLAGNSTAPANLLVELVDASNPLALRTVASARTDAQGEFDLQDGATSAMPADRWLRVQTPDGGSLRAFASGWTEISPGTELALGEISRLSEAGAFDARLPTQKELADAQAAITLWWQGQAGQPANASALATLREALRGQATWNAQLNNLASTQPAPGTGDIAGWMPLDSALLPSTLMVDGGAAAGTTARINCFPADPTLPRNCSISVDADSSLYDGLIVPRTGLVLRAPSTNDPPNRAIATAGDLPLLEHTPQVGKQVLVDNSKLDLPGTPAFRAALRITRTTYPMAPLAALGGSVPAIEVVLEYEMAFVDTATLQRVDLLAREHRWFSPGKGRVAMQTEGVARKNGVITTTQGLLVAQSVSGLFQAAPVMPMAGVADVVARGLRHRDAVAAPTLDRIYVSTATATGGAVLALDPTTLQTLQTVDLPSAASRLAIAADDSRLYVGLAGNQVAELALPALTITRRFTLSSDPNGTPYDVIRGLSVDPFNPARILVLTGNSQLLGQPGALLSYQAGSLVARDAPHYNAFDFGWGAYNLSAVAWGTTPDVFIGASLDSPPSVWRFGVGSTGFTELTASTRTDQVGVNDIGGEVVADMGTILSASTLQPLRMLQTSGWRLTGCHRFDASSALCKPADFAYTPPYWVRLDITTSAFLGLYRPKAPAPILDACPGVSVRSDSLGLDDARLVPMARGRSLVSTMQLQDDRCMLQVWSWRLPR